MRVLFVDDDTGILCMYQQQLEETQNAIEPDYAETVEDAIKLLDANQYDAVVCDGNFPQKRGRLACQDSGEQVLTKARELNVPIRWIASFDNKAIQKALDSGAATATEEKGKAVKYLLQDFSM